MYIPQNIIPKIFKKLHFSLGKENFLFWVCISAKELINNGNDIVFIHRILLETHVNKLEVESRIVL